VRRLARRRTDALEKQMLHEILSALSGTDVLAEMIEQVAQMLEAGRWMFAKASEVLMRTAEWKDVAADLYTRDRKINQLEQSVREKIITHLSVGNQADLSACLVLMNVVKDAERIGDYCKNIFEVGKFYEHDYTRPHYARPLEGIRHGIDPLFGKAAKAFTDADRTIARDVLSAAGGLTRTCDVIIQQLLSSNEEMAADEAVAYVLLARFYKRVSAHLGNIASTVVSPVPLIDYRGETKLAPAE
jgi:phosphate transport system protein